MKAQEIIAKVKALNLPPDSYIVYGSAPLALASIREASDIDLLVSSDTLQYLKTKGWKLNKDKQPSPYVYDGIEAFTTWESSSYQPTLKQLLATATYVDGVAFASIYEVRKWKEAFNRSKDKEDVRLIDKYLKSKNPKATITICSSASFYRQAVDIEAALEKMGYKAVVPITVNRMKKSGDFNPDHYKTWYDVDSDYYKKTILMRTHFDEVKKGDAVLVLNYEKNGVPNYIGGNVLTEMSLAFYLKKPIFILNEVPLESSFLEEILGFNPVILHGAIESLEMLSIKA